MTARVLVVGLVVLVTLAGCGPKPKPGTTPAPCVGFGCGLK